MRIDIQVLHFLNTITRSNVHVVIIFFCFKKSGSIGMICCTPNYKSPNNSCMWAVMGLMRQ